MAIDDNDLSRLREVFVTRQECNTTTDALNNKLSAYITRLAVIEQKVTTITWLCTAIVGGVIAALIKLFIV